MFVPVNVVQNQHLSVTIRQRIDGAFHVDGIDRVLDQWRHRKLCHLAVVVAKDTSDNIYSQAETFTMRLDLSGVARWRVIYLNEGGTSVDSAIWVRHIEVSSFG